VSFVPDLKTIFIESDDLNWFEGSIVALRWKCDFN
jgi:hypothetical protein